jgi:hypothetical protein
MMCKKIIVFFFASLFFLLSFSPIIHSLEISTNKKDSIEMISNDEQELTLLSGDFYLTMVSTANTDSFNVRYAFPMDYHFQVPLFLYLANDSTGKILDYQIENDTDGINKIVNFTICPLEKDEKVKIHFAAWVLVKNDKFDDLPSYVKMPTEDELPEETKQWLVSTDVVQVNNPLIKFRARLLKRITDNQIKLVKKIARFTRWHRSICFYLSCRTYFWFSQDAVTTLLLSGDCPGKSHLGCALLRANGIPARVIYGIPLYPSWYGSHSMIEYYVPNYGWVYSEIPKGYTTYEPKKRFNLRISFPWEENNTDHYDQSERIIGMHRWFWIDDEDIEYFYYKPSEGYNSMMQCREENNILTDYNIANEVFQKTREIYYLYEFYQQIDLVGDNLIYYQNATSYQKDAIFELSVSDNLNDYLFYLEKAEEEYNKIIL